MNLRKKLSFVYKAKDCTDINDVDIALDEVQRLASWHGWTRALGSRHNSLTKRREQFA